MKYYFSHALSLMIYIEIEDKIIINFSMRVWYAKRNYKII